MHHVNRIAVVCLFLLASACASPVDGGDAPAVGSGPAVDTAPILAPDPTPRRIGGDRDAHGCLPAAGYQWCERTGRCERSWELAKKEGFSLDAKGFETFCAGAPTP
jgi:hypothetical protein